MKIYHILQGNVLHLTPSIIKGLILCKNKISQDENIRHIFCVCMYGNQMLYDNVDKNPYPLLFNSLEYTDYILLKSRKSFFMTLFNIDNKDKIIFHSNPDSFDYFIVNSLFILFKHKLLKRCSFICWGNDYQVPKGGFKYNVYKAILSKAFNSYKFIAAISLEDSKEVASLFPKANVVYAPYMSSARRVLRHKIINSDGLVHVMVSHSGWKHNNHLKTFNLLRKYSGKIKVVCPLCYGDSDYIKDVVDAGSKMFGKDFSYFSDLMSLDNYRKFLQTIDVYVTSAENQTGLGAIFFSMESGTKVYITGNLYKSLLMQDFIVFNTDQIKNMSFDDFVKPINHFEANFNVENYNRLKFEGNEALPIWREIFEY